MLGLRPPWTQKMLSSTIAAKDKQSNTSVQQRHTFKDPYFLRHSSQNPQTWVICLHSWLPLISVTKSGYLTLQASNKRKVSTLLKPLSTKSPRKRQQTPGMSPPFLKSQSRSQNWPCMSPQMVTGESTRCTFPSSTRISRAFEQRCLTSCSLMIYPLRSCQICLSI